MKTETYLQGARDLHFRIKQLEAERAEVMGAMISIKSTSDYSERVQTSPRGDGLERQVIRIMEKLEQKDRVLNRQIVALIMRRDAIRKRLFRMKEGQGRRFLVDYYLNCKSWAEIFEEYGIEPDYHIKKKAIAELERMEAARKKSQCKHS